MDCFRNNPFCCRSVIKFDSVSVSCHKIRLSVSFVSTESFGILIVSNESFGTNCAPLVADLFLFCYERDFMTSLSDVKQAESIEAFKSTSTYLDDLLNIDNHYFEGMVNRIYPPELQLNKANTSDTESPFFGFAFIYFKRICFI